MPHGMVGVSMSDTTKTTTPDVIRCDRCTRPATHKIRKDYAADHDVTGRFCGRHAEKCGMPCVGLTAAAAGFGPRRKPITDPKESP